MVVRHEILIGDPIQISTPGETALVVAFVIRAAAVLKRVATTKIELVAETGEPWSWTPAKQEFLQTVAASSFPSAPRIQVGKIRRYPEGFGVDVEA